MDGPMRRLPVATCTRESHPGPPRSLSPLLAHRKPRGESRSRPPTGTPRGRGGGRRRQRRQKAGRGYLLAYLSLPLIYYCPAPFNLPGRVNKNKRKNPIHPAATCCLRLTDYLYPIFRVRGPMTYHRYCLPPSPSLSP
jgi:hypothetical protein